MIYSFPKEFNLPNGWKLRISNPKDDDYYAAVIHPSGETVLDGRYDGSYADFEEFERAMSNEFLVEALDAACKSVEHQANWDKEPYCQWYYKAIAALKQAKEG